MTTNQSAPDWKQPIGSSRVARQKLKNFTFFFFVKWRCEIFQGSSKEPIDAYVFMHHHPKVNIYDSSSRTQKALLTFYLTPALTTFSAYCPYSVCVSIQRNIMLSAHLFLYYALLWQTHQIELRCCKKKKKTKESVKVEKKRWLLAQSLEHMKCFLN